MSAYPQQSQLPQQQENPEDSFGSWMLTLFLAGIPVVGFIYQLVLAFSSTAAPSKRNWARAALVWSLIAFVLMTLIFMIAGAGLMAMLEEAANSSM